MKKQRIPSVVPVYVFGITWALYCLIFPTSRLWHFLICAAVSLAAWGIARLFAPQTERLKPDRTGNKDLDELLAYGAASLQQLREINRRLPAPELTEKLDTVTALTDRIFEKLEKSPEKTPQVRRFMDYYLPTTVRLLERRVELEQSGVDTENVRSAAGRIEAMLDTVITAFRSQLDSLYENDLVDITADIRVMQQLMKSEGLTEKEL